MITEERLVNFRHYSALVAAALVPIWSSRYFPTIDGPSHVYNAWVLQQLVRGNHLVAQWYAIDWRPNPNWSGHVVMALLMTIFPPVVSEKLLVSGIVALFGIAMWLYAGCADDSARPLAVIALPFSYHLLLQAGFYNFSIGVALYFFIVAIWWRRRDRPDVRTIAIVAALLLLCYFSHPLPAMLAVLSIGILWIATLPGRRKLAHAAHLIALVPVSALLIWFIRGQGATVASPHRKLADLFLYMWKMWPIVSMQHRQATFGTLLFVTIVGLVLLTLLRRRGAGRESDGFILITLLLIVLYAGAPETSSGGSLIMERMAIFVAISPFAWIAPRLSKRVVTGIAIAAAIAFLIDCGFLASRYRDVSRHIDRLVRSANALGSDTTFIPLIRNMWMPGTFVPFAPHQIDYAAVAKRDVDLLNYEPRAGYFPTKVRPGVSLPPIVDVGERSMDADVAPYFPMAEYLFTWEFLPEAQVFGKIHETYDLVGEKDSGRVYRRRS